MLLWLPHGQQKFGRSAFIVKTRVPLCSLRFFFNSTWWTILSGFPRASRNRIAKRFCWELTHHEVSWSLPDYHGHHCCGAGDCRAIQRSVLAAPGCFPGEASMALITIDYPLEGSVFPPDMAAPTFLWRDSAKAALEWRIDVTFTDGSAATHAAVRGEPMRVGEIDPRCVSVTNELPKLTPEQAGARTWMPDVMTWEAIKKHSLTYGVTVTITGYHDEQAVSRGRVAFQTSQDPVGAPIFYRDVPLMPAELEKGMIKPLPPKMLPFVAWRVRDVHEPDSRLVMEGLHTCANCHSFSRDGKTLGMDLDGPQNDKGLYAIVPVGERMSIRNEDVISWKSFRDQTAMDKRIGFMSQVSRTDSMS